MTKHSHKALVEIVIMIVDVIVTVGVTMVVGVALTVEVETASNVASLGTLLGSVHQVMGLEEIGLVAAMTVMVAGMIGMVEVVETVVMALIVMVTDMEVVIGMGVAVVAQEVIGTIEIGQVHMNAQAAAAVVVVAAATVHNEWLPLKLQARYATFFQV